MSSPLESCTIRRSEYWIHGSFLPRAPVCVHRPSSLEQAVLLDFRLCVFVLRCRFAILLIRYSMVRCCWLIDRLIRYGLLWFDVRSRLFGFRNRLAIRTQDDPLPLFPIQTLLFLLPCLSLLLLSFRLLLIPGLLQQLVRIEPFVIVYIPFTSFGRWPSFR